MNTSNLHKAVFAFALSAFWPIADSFAQQGSLDRYGFSGAARGGAVQSPRSGHTHTPWFRTQSGPQPGMGGNGGFNRPTMPNPSVQTRPFPQPSFGTQPQRMQPIRPSGFNPITGGPNMNFPRPTTLPGMNEGRRPSVTRPSYPGINPNAGRPSHTVQRPTVNQPPVVRPSIRPIPGGQVSRPPIQQPSLKPPLNRPSYGNDHPPFGRPSIATRPSIPSPSIRPSYPTNRPGSPTVNRPPWNNDPHGGHQHGNHPHGWPGNYPPGWVGNRPPVTRPTPGDDHHHHHHHHRPPAIGGYCPPGWYSGYNYAAAIRNLSRYTTINMNNWGLGVSVGYPSYGDYWYSHCVNNYHRSWYNGCWTAGNSWYTPFVPGTMGWGIDASYYGWGMQPAYVNPYYVVVQRPSYDYSRPIVIQTISANGLAGQDAQAQQPQNDPATEKAMATFDQAVVAFRAHEYSSALNLIDQAIRGLPNDPLLHEVRAATLFALGEYRPAAAVLNSLLATSPGMDWSSMSQLYGDTNQYTKHLQALQTHIAGNPQDTAALFLLAYHYLVLQETSAAVQALKIVVAREPDDVVARKILESLAPPDPDEVPAGPESIPSPQTGAQDSSPGPSRPEISMAGQWAAVDASDTKIVLTIDDQSKFTWTATPKDAPPTKVEGVATATYDSLVLESQDLGTMVAQVEPIDAQQFKFKLVGAKTDDPGVIFRRVK